MVAGGPVDEPVDVGGGGGNAVEEEGEEGEDHHHRRKLAQARQRDPDTRQSINRIGY